MIEHLIALALRQRAAVVGGTLLLIGAGAWALSTIHLDAFPDLTPNQVQVLTVAPGLSPNEVENLVSYPIETAMMGLPRTRGRPLDLEGRHLGRHRRVRGRRRHLLCARPGAAAHAGRGRRPARGAASDARPAATPMGEVFQYLVESDSASLMELKNLQEYTIKPLLRTIPGVADVNSWGGMVQQFHVDVDPHRLAGYGLTLDDVAAALEANNSNFGAGYVENRGERLTIRGLGRVANETDIASVVLATRGGGTPIFVRDVAAVTDRSDAARGRRLARRPR